ncbi:MAG: hypothetical protein CVU89_03935 [Firmicutes bacterium HGW-Firmicutes-14]|nr:MAG: hypothetical protein CVU89_03935 [Firmicutes bacterium HGW-Firmicutes-14]
MPVKRCAICKKPSYTDSRTGSANLKWTCSACEKRFEEDIKNVRTHEGGKICEKCIKRKRNQCPFSSWQRSKILACTDWEGKNTEHNRKRWAKFEQD